MTTLVERIEPVGDGRIETLVNTKAGAHRVVHGTVINIGDALAWAHWLGNDRLAAGAEESPNGLSNDNHYLVDARDG